MDEGRAPIHRLAAASVISIVGTEAAAVAFGFYVYDRTGSALWISAWFFLTFGINGLLGPVGGAIADRFDRRRVMVLANLGAALCSVALVFVRAPAAMIAIAFVASVIGRTYGPAANASIPNLAGAEQLTWANGTMSVAWNTGRLVGPVLGGALVGPLGIGPVFAADALTFVVSALLIGTLRGRFRAEADAADVEAKHRGILAGFRLIWNDPSLRALIGVWTALYFAVDIVLVGELPLASAFGVGALAYGLLQAAWGGGSVLGSLAARRVPDRLEPLTILIGALGVVVGYTAIALAPWWALVLAGMAIVAICDALGTVAGFGVIQRRSPDAVRGRVFGTFSTMGLLANAIAFAIAGFLVEWIGARGIYAVGALVAAAAAPFLAPLFRAGATAPPAVEAAG